MKLENRRGDIYIFSFCIVYFDLLPQEAMRAVARKTDMVFPHKLLIGCDFI